MIETQLIFPTKVYRSTFEDSLNVQKDVIPYFLDIESKDKSPVRYSANGYTSYGVNSSVLSLPMLKALKEYLDETVQKCHEESRLNGEPKLESSWFSIMRKHTYHEEHHHMPSVWSGVYYVKAEENCGDLNFYDPSADYKNHCGDVCNTIYRVTPQPGMFLTFPSWLPHQSNPNKSLTDRIIISYNFYTG